MIGLPLLPGTVSSRTKCTLNLWADGVQNPDDLYFEHYWDYLAGNLERPENLHDIK